MLIALFALLITHTHHDETTIIIARAPGVYWDQPVDLPMLLFLPIETNSIYDKYLLVEHTKQADATFLCRQLEHHLNRTKRSVTAILPHVPVINYASVLSF